MSNTKQNIVYHLWYDTEASEAAAFYTSIFPNSQLTNRTTLNETPNGDANLVSFELWGHSFMAISAGPHFTFNPSISFMVNFDLSRDKDAREKIDQVWERLSEGGTVLMPLDSYPFSDRYGWIQDKYGLTWQLILTNPEGEERPVIIPSMTFVGDQCGKAEEAIQLYLSIFEGAKEGVIARYPAGMEPDQEGTIMFADFMLCHQWFVAMDSAQEHHFSFNEAVSLMVYCDTQEEIDHYWDKLSAVPAAEQCGWLKDKYGVSWQIVPRIMDELMTTGTPEQINRVNQAVLQMKKLDITAIKAAHENQ
ncbi:VOC family protein [Gracilibacillus alcaliphilus]|uniref:VOC family protein n=1 Tax=Gracilibacillus alcaliphilus TaxID=1401441 RepID=UPI00195B24DD|nr:VOC family protein [Gracilibacillus alcaliphilus]MBM7676708.1 putative 3-demethylubiquinone-9 3-methyltransferase (glyoxalase superfamily) [Gracilibacillus alcaliphilus]